MIELDNTFKPDGIHGIVRGLYTARVVIKPDPTHRPGFEFYKVTTVRVHAGQRLLGSTRHSHFLTYNEAEEYALGYANRVAKQKREKDAATRGHN